jgi:hypothetical protein
MKVMKKNGRKNGNRKKIKNNRKKKIENFKIIAG